jgi:hypothetical protein
MAYPHAYLEHAAYHAMKDILPAVMGVLIYPQILIIVAHVATHVQLDLHA